MTDEKFSPLHHEHLNLGARMTPFAGYSMPLRYTSEREEHLHTRSEVSIFDVSHMGEIFIEGEGATEFLQALLPANPSLLALGQAKYTMILNEKGGVIDDILIYRKGEDEYLLCTNAGNQEVDFKHVQERAKHHNAECSIENRGPELAQIAIQGPKAKQVVDGVLGFPASELAYYSFREVQATDTLGQYKMLLSRTGYTGEDGFECILPNTHAPLFWQALIASSRADVKPAGLAARDTLRLEAGMCLHGNELSQERTPLEAGLNWTIDWDEGRDFFGRKPLEKLRRAKNFSRLRGLRLVGRGVLRPGYEVFNAEQKRVGILTSGTKPPSLKSSVGMAYLERPYTKVGTRLYVQIRKRFEEVEIVRLPFYKRDS